MLSVNLRPSRRLTLFLLLAHAAAAGCVLSVALPFWLRGTLLIALLLSMVYTLADQGWRVLPWSVVSLQFEREGGALLALRNGKTLEVQVLGSSFVAPYLSIVRCKPKDKWFARSVVLLPDMLSQEVFRNLRVWLKWRIGRGVAPAASIDWTGST
jgi:toxin CptA